MLDDFGTHHGAIDTRRAYACGSVPVARDEQDSTQIEHFAWLATKALNGDRIARCDAVLLPACFDNGVHRLLSSPTSGCSRRRARRRRGQR